MCVCFNVLQQYLKSYLIQEAVLSVLVRRWASREASSSTGLQKLFLLRNSFLRKVCNWCLVTLIKGRNCWRPSPPLNGYWEDISLSAWFYCSECSAVSAFLPNKSLYAHSCGMLPLCNISHVAEVVVNKNYQGNKTFHLISSISFFFPPRETDTRAYTSKFPNSRKLINR